jgi:Fe-S-cluster-containing dehydrogenase component
MSALGTLTADSQPKGIAPNAEPPLLHSLLAEQRSLTPVARFAAMHEEHSQPLQARYYRDLIPLEQPSPGEQYAFEVDLDSCSGCKACVTACHNLNGLEPEETWRNIGLLLSSPTTSPAAVLPVLQHVTTACHHCVEPGCLEGCPTLAYEKDPVTGIVHHLDDQCFGCQYCVWMCPYEVPVYSPTKGIVRKCDMCRQRLALDEAPACVQACPNQAIRIAKIRQDEARSSAAKGAFLAGTPDPALTIPTTRYVSQRRSLADAIPADTHRDEPAHAHWPLVVMLVLTQGSVGCLALERLVSLVAGVGVLSATLQGIALLLGSIGLGAATFHLGRPHLAWRAILGLRKSWLSREMVAFGLYMQALLAACVATWLGWSNLLQHALSGFALMAGLLGLYTSAMIYIATRRPG